MNKQTFKEYIYRDVYETYAKAKNRLTIFDKIWLKYFSAEGNAVYLIRKKQYLESGNKLNRARSRFYHSLLIRRYGIHVEQGTTIGKGLRVAHPISIVITRCNIGENFTIYQNCTIGQKFWKSGKYPQIGNNVTLYSGSSIIGDVFVADNVTIGANSLLIDNAKENGVYVGSPAHLISEKR